MIARFHYDEATLDRLLHDNLRDDETDVTTHVETCDICQAKMDRLSRDGMSWDEVGELLGDSPVAELFTSFEHDGADPKVLTTSATKFLQPSKHPNSLGRFARYEIMEILGRGGMGIVMRGYDTSLGRHSAIKVLAPELASSAAARKRFSREAKSAAAVVHPHVVPIQTVDEHDGLPYLVMPVVEGPSLQQRVELDGPLSIIETVRIAAQVAEGLAAAHQQGLVHRDIKPANVLLENGVERVQITDFGLARAIDDASMTRSGVIAGTPQYMSPEQAHGDAIDHRSDLFSLGSLIYFMLTGRSPFRAETTMGVLNRIGNDEPRSLRSINTDVPQWLDAIVMKLLSKSADDRYQDASEVAELLQSWHTHLQQPDLVSRPQEQPERTVEPLPIKHQQGRGRFSGFPRNRLLVASAAMAFLAFFAGVFVLETGKGTIRIETNADAPIPIVVRKGENIVEELTVDQSGATIRLKAGEYVIELPDAAENEQPRLHPDGDPGLQPRRLVIIGDKVKLSRGGTWLAKIKLVPDGTPVGDAMSHSTVDPVMSPGTFLVEVEDRSTDDNRVIGQQLKLSIQGPAKVVLSSGADFSSVSVDPAGQTEDVIVQVQAKKIGQNESGEDRIEVRLTVTTVSTGATAGGPMIFTRPAGTKLSKVMHLRPLRGGQSLPDQPIEIGMLFEKPILLEVKPKWSGPSVDAKASDVGLIRTERSQQGDDAISFNTAEALMVEVTKRMRAGESNVKSLLDLMTDDAVNEFAGLLVQQYGLFSTMAKFSAEVGEQIDSDFAQRNETSLAELATMEKRLERYSLGEDTPETAKLAAQKIIQRAVTQTFAEDHQSAPANRSDFQTAAGVLKSPREFLADAMDGKDGLTFSAPPAIVGRTPTWSVERDSDRALATDTSGSDDPPAKFELIRTAAGWKIDSLLGGDNFVKATTVETVDSMFETGSDESGSKPSRASENHPLQKALQGKWQTHFVDNPTGDDDAKIEVIDDLLLWTDADGEFQKFLFSIREAKPYPQITLRQISPIVATHKISGLIRDKDHQIEICLDFSPDAQPPSTFEVNESQTVFQLRRQQSEASIEDNPYSLLSILKDYNDDTRTDRQTKFNPPIPDLTLDEFIAAFRAEAANYLKVGEHQIAKALEASADAERLIGELTHTSGITGVSQTSKETGRVYKRQYLPALSFITGPRSEKAIVLSNAELRWSLSGWSSPDWGIIHPPLSGQWELQSVIEDVEEISDEAFKQWVDKHKGWSKLLIENNRILVQSGIDPNRVFDLELAYDTPARFRLFLDGELHQTGLFMTDAFVDDDELKLYIDFTNDAHLKSYSTKGNSTTELVYKRVGSRPINDPVSDSQSDSDAALYQGEPQPVWQQRFDNETNPIAKIDAAKALVELSAGLDPKSRIDRIVDVTSELVRDGWGDDLDAFFTYSIVRNGRNFSSNRWSEASYPDLEKAWRSLIGLCKTQCKLATPKLLVEELGSEVTADDIANGASAADLLWQCRFHIDDDPDAVAALLALRPDSPRLTVPVHIIQMEYYSEAEAEAQIADQKFIRYSASIGESLIEDDRNWNYSLAKKWFETALVNHVRFASNLEGRIALRLLLEKPDEIRRHTFQEDWMDGGVFAYPDPWMKQARDAHFAIWDDWLPVVNDWLVAHPKPSEQSQTVLSTLNIHLRLRKKSDDWPVDRLAELLSERCQAIEASEDGESLHDLLAYLVLAGGDIPSKYFDASRLSDDLPLAGLNQARKLWMSGDYKGWLRETEKFDGLVSKDPVAVVRFAIEYPKESKDYSPMTVIARLSHRDYSDEAPPPMEPLLLLAILAELAGQNELTDQYIAHCFANQNRQYFGRHLNDALDSTFAVQSIAKRLLRRMRARAVSEELIEKIDELLPIADRTASPPVGGDGVLHADGPALSSIDVSMRTSSVAEMPADEKDSAEEKASPEFPPVKITLKDEAGKPVVGAGVLMRLLSADRRTVSVDVTGRSEEDGVAIDRVLPFGNYYTRIRTPDGWYTSIPKIPVEFDKGCDLTVTAPSADKRSTLIVESVADLTEMETLRDLPFGSLQHHFSGSDRFSPQPTPEPGEELGRYESFPTLGNGIEKVAAAIRVEVERELPQPVGSPSVFDGEWDWAPDADQSTRHFLLYGGKAYPITDLDGSSRTSASDGRYFDLPGDRRVGFLQLQLGNPEELPLKLDIVAGKTKVLLTNLYGLASDDVIRSLNLEPSQERIWLPTNVQNNSAWVKRLPGMDDWKFIKPKSSYHGHIVRREQALRQGETMMVSIGVSE